MVKQERFARIGIVIRQGKPEEDRDEKGIEGIASNLKYKEPVSGIEYLLMQSLLELPLSELGSPCPNSYHWFSADLYSYNWSYAQKKGKTKLRKYL